MLAGFTLNGSIYNSLDEALIAAHALHCPKISIPSTQDIKEEIEPAPKQITSGFQVQNSDSKSSIQISAQNELEQTSQNEINYKKYQSTKSSNTKIIFASIALIVVAFLVFRYIQLSQDNVLNYSNSSPEDRCRAAKIQALKSSEPFFVALMKGERGMSVTGYQEAISATKAAGLVCGIDNYTYSNLLNESEFTGSGFALKQDKEIKNSASEITKSDAAVINYPSSQTSEPCKKVGEARFNSAVAEKCSGTWNVYASIPNGGVWYSDKMGNDPEAKQINSQAKKVEERLQGCGLVVHISLSNWFDSFTSNLVVVHSSPHPSAVEAAEELKRMKQCGIDGYSKKSDYRVAGRD